MDEVEEGEMVEDKLIIPEEFKNYLNQVADNELIAGNTTNTANNMNVNANANPNVDDNANDKQQINQSQMPQSRQVNGNGNGNASSFNQWRNSQAYQMPSPLNQPQSPPLNPTPSTPAAHATDMWPCTQYQQTPPPYPNYYNQNGQSPSNPTTHMNCNYNNTHGYNSSANNYGHVNYGAYKLRFQIVKVTKLNS